MTNETLKVATPAKYGARATLTQDERRRDPQLIEYRERHTARSVDQALELSEVVEIPGTRHGVWEYREECLTIPAYVLAEIAGDDDTPERRAQILDLLAGALAAAGQPIAYRSPGGRLL